MRPTKDSIALRLVPSEYCTASTYHFCYAGHPITNVLAADQTGEGFPTFLLVHFPIEMERNERIINLYIALLVPVGLCALIWAFVGFPYLEVGPAAWALALVTIFLSSTLRIQLPRHNIHLTISDALVITMLFLYGGEVALFVAAGETAYTTLMFRRSGLAIKPRTILLNSLIAMIGVFSATLTVRVLLQSNETYAVLGQPAEFAMAMAAVAINLFLINTLCLAPFLAIKHQRSLPAVLNEYWSDSLLVYTLGSLMAGCILVAFQQVNVYIAVAVASIFGLVYWTYRRNINDVRTTSAAVRDSEKLRAEQAERHVEELEHYVTELVKSADALKTSREEFRYAAFHDGLTDLPNRNAILGRITELIQDDEKFAVMFLDLDRFRTVNDSLGHRIGDQLIVEVGERITAAIDGRARIGRFSGDEFAILVEGASGAKSARKLADSIVQRIDEPFLIDGSKIFTSVSIGIAFGPANYSRPEEVMRDADIAMYNAKDGNKGIVEFDNQMHELAVRLHQIETDLRGAVERREFEVFYQPIVGLANGDLAGFEALVRWNHPIRGMISPIDFIPVAESTGLIIPMTEQILDEACRNVVRWREMSKLPLSISVNFSGKHFVEPNVAEMVNSVLTRTGLEPGSLKMEITESAVMENAEAAITILERIKASGVKISIDDFGTGYSSLSYLQRFPIDTLKVDRSFVSVMEEKSENGAIVRTIITLAKALQLNVVAEGVETTDQFQRLRGLGCEFGQGYLFSRPVPASHVDELISNSTSWTKFADGPPVVHSADLLTIDLTEVSQ